MKSQEIRDSYKRCVRRLYHLFRDKSYRNMRLTQRQLLLPGGDAQGKSRGTRRMHRLPYSIFFLLYK